MTRPDLLGLIVQAAAGAGTGLLLGRLYFALLWRSAARLVVRVRPLVAVAALVLRFGSAVGVLGLLAAWGSAALLAGLVGFTVARLMFKVRAEMRT